MSFQIRLNCIPTKIDENDDFKNIINNHTQRILELQIELNTYKSFYNQIVNNNVITDKFEEYNNIIDNLKKENAELKVIVEKKK